MIIRTLKENNYCVIGNYHLRDKNLSLKAKGLMTLMLSLPDDWEISPKGLSIVTGKDGIDTIKNSLKELENEGYLIKNQCRNDDGKFGKIDYILYEKPYMENPLMENPSTDKPLTENPTQLNINNNKILNKLNTKEIKNYNKKNFETFWNEYPKKQSKAKTEQWFIKNNPNDELFEIMLNKLKQFKKTKQWKDIQYIPLATTWLNQKRWEDEIEEVEDSIQTKEDELAYMKQLIEERKAKGTW